MTDEIVKSDNAEDGDKVAEKTETETKEPKEKPRVSFNRDVHVKRFGKPRESRGTSSDPPSIRKEPFTHLSEQELINEANKVLEQASSVTCTADHPPDKFFSLPHRRKFKEDKLGRRNSDDTTPGNKAPLGRSTSDVSSKKKKERTSISTLFRRAQRNKSPDAPVVVTTKPIAVVKRSKSDVTDLKSNTILNTQTKPIRKRSGSETEEFLKSLRNKKTQLSPIIESSPRDDYFKKTPPLDIFQKQKIVKKESNNIEVQIPTDNKKINPVEKPPRYKTPETKDPKPPTRTKRGKSLEKEKEALPGITDKRNIDVKKPILVDEIDSFKPDSSTVEVKERIKDSIRKIEENVYGEKEMIHSSQQPPDKPPLTRGNAVGHMVRILREDQFSPPPKSHLILPTNGTNVNQPFSYIKPSMSPDPNLFIRNTSPDRIPSPVNKMNDKGIIYAEVLRNNGDVNPRINKQTMHKTFNSDKYGNLSDEDEGLGYEERYKYSKMFDSKLNDHEKFNNTRENGVPKSPLRSPIKDYNLRSYDEFEPTYANEYPIKEDSHNLIDKFRGRADGMDTKKKQYESDNTKVDLNFNELSHRRQQLESRLNARRYERDRLKPDDPISRYLESDPIYEAEKRMRATEKFVNETVRYCRNTVERDGFAESSITEDYDKYDSDNYKIKYNTETRNFQNVAKGDVDRRDFIDSIDSRYRDDRKIFPPEPEYEPPSLESNIVKPVLTPDEYKEKKYRVKKTLNSSHDLLQTGQKYKKDDYFGRRKGHYASNPEIAHEREDDYANLKYKESFHNSLRRSKSKDRYRDDFGITRHNSGDSREYYREDKSPRRFDMDNRLVDSGIENDFRKDSSEIHTRYRHHESDDDVRNTSLFLASERRHTEDNYPSEQIYANGEYLARFKEYRDETNKKEYGRERSADDGSRFEQKIERYEKSPSRLEDKISAKPPKAAKKLSGLEKMKQLFSRDSSKKSKKEKEPVQSKTRTRVLKSPEHLAKDDSEYRRYTDPEPSDIVVRKIDYECSSDDRRYRSKDSDRYRTPDPRERSSRDTNERYKTPEVRERGSREDLNRYRSMEIRERSSRDDLDRLRADKERSNKDENRFRTSDKQRSSRDGSDNYKDRGSRDDLDRFRERNSRESERYRSSGTRERSVRDDHRYRIDQRERSSREDLDRFRNADVRDSDVERKYREPNFGERYDRTLKEERRYKEEKRRYNSSDRESDHQSRPSDGESELRKTRSRTAGPLDSPALAERYRERRRLATPSPTPSPPRRQNAGTNWFKSLDRLTRKKGKSSKQTEKESVITTEDESTRKTWQKSKPLNSPAKNLRFFGDTDVDSDANQKQSTTKAKTTLRKTISNSSTGLDEVDNNELSNKSYSLSSLHEKDKTPPGYRYKRNLQNISEINSNSETESQFERKMKSKPPLPYETRSRSHSSSKTLKGSKGDLRRRTEERGSSSELRSSKQDINRELKHRRRTPVTNSAESSTEGDSSQQSQRSVVYLHATTVGDIPNPERLTRNRSRDDVSSVNSSNIQVRSTTKSFSIFAPWTPKHYNEQFDVHYAQKPRKSKSKEPIKKAASTKTLNEDRSTLQKKSYSQSTLTRRPQNNRLSTSNTTLYKKPENRKKETQATLRKSTRDSKKSQSTDVINRENEREKVSRSISMPKDQNKKAGWFKLSSKNKKPEINTRVR